MMIKRLTCTCLLLVLFSQTLYAGVDQEFGGKSYWWTPYYSQFLSHLGLEKSYALVVGVGEYNDSTFVPLPSEQDAIRIKDYLLNKAGFDHVRLITGDKATRERIHGLMNSFYLPTLASKDRFLFYWSGHGVTAGQSARKLGYLAVQKSNNNPATMLSMDNVRNWDNQLKAKQTLYLLDACFSGIAAAQAMSPTQEQTIDRVSHPSRQVLTAGLENQQTIAINDMKGGVFTRALLDGLDGHADTDKGNFKKDGVVTARELETYVRQRVDHERRRVGWQSPITPVLYNFRDYAGDFFFVSDKQKLSKTVLIPSKLTPDEGVVATGFVTGEFDNNNESSSEAISRNHGAQGEELWGFDHTIGEFFSAAFSLSSGINVDDTDIQRVNMAVQRENSLSWINSNSGYKFTLRLMNVSSRELPGGIRSCRLVKLSASDTSGDSILHPEPQENWVCRNKNGYWKYALVIEDNDMF